MKRLLSVLLAVLLLVGLTSVLCTPASAVVVEDEKSIEFKVFLGNSFNYDIGRKEIAPESEATFDSATITSGALPAGLKYSFTKDRFTVSGTFNGTKPGVQTVVFCLELSDDWSTYTRHMTITFDLSLNDPEITKHPTAETVTEGGECYFVAKGKYQEGFEWFFKKPGVYYAMTADDAMKELKGLKISGEHKNTLHLTNIPLEMNGWEAYCVLYNAAAEVQTKTAKITVNPAPTPEPTPETTVAPSTAPSPEPTAEVTPIPTPEQPDASPSAAPSEQPSEEPNEPAEDPNASPNGPLISQPSTDPSTEPSTAPTPAPTTPTEKASGSGNVLMIILIVLLSVLVVAAGVIIGLLLKRSKR